MGSAVRSQKYPQMYADVRRCTQMYVDEMQISAWDGIYNVGTGFKPVHKMDADYTSKGGIYHGYYTGSYWRARHRHR